MRLEEEGGKKKPAKKKSNHQKKGKICQQLETQGHSRQLRIK